MGQYTTVTGQNIYDVTLNIYGSIDGLTDLLVNNPSLSISETIASGTKLMYTDDLIVDKGVVTNLRASGVTPSNGSRGVYYKPEPSARIIDIICETGSKYVSFSVSGRGHLYIDWGDNAEIDTITLEDKIITCEHTFNYTRHRPKIKIFGDVVLKTLNVSKTSPKEIFFLTDISLESYIQNNNVCPVEHLRLGQGLYNADLQRSKFKDLSALTDCVSLMSLNLLNANVTPAVIESYLIDLVNNYGSRRGCSVMITPPLSGQYQEPVRDENNKYDIRSAMEAVWVLTHEPSWQEAGDWILTINGITYKP